MEATREEKLGWTCMFVAALLVGALVDLGVRSIYWLRPDWLREVLSACISLGTVVTTFFGIGALIEAVDEQKEENRRMRGQYKQSIKDLEARWNDEGELPRDDPPIEAHRHKGDFKEP